MLAKYYNNKNVNQAETGCKQLTTLKDQRAYEKALWEKTKKAGGEWLTRTFQLASRCFPAISTAYRLTLIDFFSWLSPLYRPER